MVKVECSKALGKKLYHSITTYSKDKKEKIAFYKGKILTEQDINILHNMGKKFIYVDEIDTSKENNFIHEDVAAMEIAEFSFPCSSFSVSVRTIL